MLPLDPLGLPIVTSSPPLALTVHTAHQRRHMLDRVFDGVHTLRRVGLGVFSDDGLGQGSNDGTGMVAHSEARHRPIHELGEKPLSAGRLGQK